MKDEITDNNQLVNIHFGLERIASFKEPVTDWEDFKKRFLYGMGLSEITYKNFISGIRVFFDEWSRTQNPEGLMLHPAEITDAHIELFFDYFKKTRKIESTIGRISQLRVFFDRLSKKFPFFESPFDRMNEKLKKKLKGPKPGNRKKRFPTSEEINRIFDYLKEKNTLRAQYTYVLCKFLFWHGFRISEALSLKWDNVKQFGSDYIITFIGKGPVEAEQKLDPRVLEELRELDKAIGADDNYLIPLPMTKKNRRSAKNVSRRPTGFDTLMIMKELEEEVNAKGILDWNIKITNHFWRHCLGTYLTRERKIPVLISDN